MGRASELEQANDRVSEETPLDDGWLHGQPNSDNNSLARAGACRPYYYLALWLRRYVGATSLCLDRAPTHEATVRAQKTSLPCLFGGAGQWACTIPASTTNTVICFALLSSSLTWQGKRKPIQPCPLPRNGPFIPSRERRRDFPGLLIKLTSLVNANNHAPTIVYASFAVTLVESSHERWYELPHPDC
jgi:hypothetical protein